MIKHRDIKMIETLERLASDVAPVRSARIAAAVCIGKDVISYGTNQTKTHTFQQRFRKKPEACYWHAETHAIYNALKRVNIDDLSRATLYIARMKYDGPVARNAVLVRGIAKPCIGCQSCIDWVGIKRVCYTTDDGKMELINA